MSEQDAEKLKNSWDNWVIDHAEQIREADPPEMALVRLAYNEAWIDGKAHAEHTATMQQIDEVTKKLTDMQEDRRGKL